MIFYMYDIFAVPDTYTLALFVYYNWDAIYPFGRAKRLWQYFFIS